VRIRTGLRDLLVDTQLWNLRQRVRAGNELRSWSDAGRPMPPPHAVKQEIVASVATSFGLRTLIETGTYLGDMVQSQRENFDLIYSIELGVELSRRAERRFRRAAHIRIIQGDSGVVLPVLLREITVPCLFWLDGHYSGGITAQGIVDSPVLSELRTILAHPLRNHVILIDDARCFDGTHGYPTLQQLERLVSTTRSDVSLSTYDDVIRIIGRSVEGS
jgi:hypothetical protein